jgi:pimeloyl-ACP methyl ester carboxylesterase
MTSAPHLRSDSAELPPVRRNPRILAVVAIIFGLPIVLWIVGAAYVARSIRYPAFLDQGSGQDVFGARVPEKSSHPYAELSAALGVSPEEFQAGVTQSEISGMPVEASGWLIRGSRRETVLLIPAAGGSEEQLIAYILPLHQAGYTVVALESPASRHLGTDWGWTEHRLALLSAAKLRALGYDKVAALGISEGAVAAILAQSEHPVFRAIVADSPYANLRDIVNRNPSIVVLNPAFKRTVLWIAGRWHRLPIDQVSPQSVANKLTGTPLLIIQNGDDHITPVADGEAIRTACRCGAELWVAPVQGHGNAIYDARDAYVSRVLEFLKRSFAR